MKKKFIFQNLDALLAPSHSPPLCFRARTAGVPPDQQPPQPERSLPRSERGVGYEPSAARMLDAVAGHVAKRIKGVGSSGSAVVFVGARWMAEGLE
eukprot:352966-Chlamydomonas_euryale.AAC.2